jgi:hypothetical protein
MARSTSDSVDLAALLEKAAAAIREQGSDERVHTLTGTGPAEQLYNAVQRNDEDACVALLASGIDPNMQAAGQYVPFLAACRTGSITIVKAMVLHGARVTPQALENAVLCEQRDVFFFLLDQPVASLGTKTRDRDAFALIRERVKKLKWGDANKLLRPHREALDL